MVRCSGNTQLGKRCKKDCTKGDTFCYAHKDKGTKSPKSKTQSPPQYTKKIAMKNTKGSKETPDFFSLYDKEMALEAVRNDGNTLKYLPRKFQSDKDVVMAAVQKNGMAFKFATPKLRGDKDLVIEAVQENGNARQFARDYKYDDTVLASYMSQYDMAMKEVQIRGYSLSQASPDLRHNKEIVLAAVRKEGRALEFAHEDLQHDKDVVTAAVLQNSEAFHYVSDELRGDGEFLYNLWVISKFEKLDDDSLVFKLANEEMRAHIREDNNYLDEFGPAIKPAK